MLPVSILDDDGGRGVAQALGLVSVAVVVVLVIAIVVPVLLIGGLVHGDVSLVAVSAVSPIVIRGPSSTAPRSQAAGPSPSELPSTRSAAAVEVARRYLNVPYVFGGTNPAVGLDCSGLVQLVYRQLGISLPRTAQQQFDATARLTREQLRPGDLVFFAHTYDDPYDWVTHVGIYIGDGLQINAPTEGQVVSIQPVFTGFWGTHFVAGGRVGDR